MDAAVAAGLADELTIGEPDRSGRRHFTASRPGDRLQHLLREKAGVKKGNLYDEIEEVVNSKSLPSDLAEALHHVRVIGNFAAHPEKSVNTGAIVDVAPGEAEWTLDVLESLFDFYFARPAKLAERKAALDKKLAEAGKPPMK